MPGGPVILDIHVLGGITARAEALTLQAQQHPTDRDVLLTVLSDLNAVWGQMSPLVTAYPTLAAYQAIHPPRTYVGNTHLDRLRQYAAMENSYKHLNQACAIVNAIQARLDGVPTTSRIDGI
jgi:hypothetical protein